ncbi:leucyl-tRNA synthetase, partial [Pleomassaria siparia CBS 279.74]
MFPYPSGTLHIGHLRVYTISDTLARFKFMQGYEVLHPIGWDAFGLPAENAAIERGVHPEAWTTANISAMKAQMEDMGGQWDWDREFQTCDPEFYQHTQRIFLMLHERGLAYQAESMVNYDPVDKTVLANEQVDANGCSWRSGAKVQKVMLKQWFLNIKKFQEPLLKDLDGLAENGSWPERVIAMQRNWLGRSEGTRLWFDIQSENPQATFKPVDVFTTRADTIFGVEYIALSLTHPLVRELAKEDESLRAFLERAADFPPDSREGYRLPNVTAKNPISAVVGDTAIPPLHVYVAPYVLDDYGSGAVMGVPGHDTRDNAFWQANAGSLGFRKVITEKPGESMQRGDFVDNQPDNKPMVKKGFIATDVEEFGNLPSDEAVDAIITRLRQAGQPVEKTENWRLRDWLISRQRYWGTPIPIVHCESCGTVPVPDSDLPVRLPRLDDEKFKGITGNPLAEDKDWKNVTCPKCGSAAERETDTMDTFMDSSWYFFRFLTTKSQQPFQGMGKDNMNAGMPVDIYVGGIEHAILHLLYARFISKFLATTPFWEKGHLVDGEPFKKLISQGMVHGKTYSDPETGRFLHPAEVDKSTPSAPLIKSSKLPANVSFEKMSKSKHNGVDPTTTIARYGADVARAHMLFQAPVSDVLEWDETSITGVQRWLTRVLEISNAEFMYKGNQLLKAFKPPKNLDRTLIEILRDLRALDVLKPVKSRAQVNLSPEQELIESLGFENHAFLRTTYEIIASVNKSYSETYSLNTIVSDLMTLTNAIESTTRAPLAMVHLRWQATVHLLRMLAPIAPSVAEEAWETLHTRTNPRIRHVRSHPLRRNGGPSIFAFGFPTPDPEAIRLLNTTMKCVFQVDGKRKFEVEISNVPVSIAEVEHRAQWILERIWETEAGKEWLQKTGGKLWNIVDSDQAHPFFHHVPKSCHVISANSGRILNVVLPK